MKSLGTVTISQSHTQTTGAIQACREPKAVASLWTRRALFKHHATLSGACQGRCAAVKREWETRGLAKWGKAKGRRGKRSKAVLSGNNNASYHSSLERQEVGECDNCLFEQCTKFSASLASTSSDHTQSSGKKKEKDGKEKIRHKPVMSSNRSSLAPWELHSSSVSAKSCCPSRSLVLI